LHQLLFQRINISCVEVVALKGRVYFNVSARKWVVSFQSAELKLNFCIKLIKNACETCAMLSEVYGGE